MIDLDKIKEAFAHIVERAKANRIGESQDRPINWECACARCKADRAMMLVAVPEMVREIERLRALARDGWKTVIDLAGEGAAQRSADRADAAMKEIEAAS